jgi:hypothetical protein
MKHKKRGESLRRGKWSNEEEAYCMKMIQLFNQGLLPIQSGTTLRSYLSKQLQCNPMRVTKKFSGSSCIGKQIFQPCDETSVNIDLMKKGELELIKLENTFRSRIKYSNSTKRRRSVSIINDDNNSDRNRYNIRYNKNENQGSSSNSTDYDEDDYDEEDYEDDYDDDDDDDENNSYNQDISTNESKFPEDEPYYKLVPRRAIKQKSSITESGNSLFVSLNKDLSFQTISAMGLTVEYDKYIKDIDAAGDILLQFSEKIKSDDAL